MMTKPRRNSELLKQRSLQSGRSECKRTDWKFGPGGVNKSEWDGLKRKNYKSVTEQSINHHWFLGTISGCTSWVNKSHVSPLLCVVCSNIIQTANNYLCTEIMEKVNNWHHAITGVLYHQPPWTIKLFVCKSAETWRSPSPLWTITAHLCLHQSL